MSHSLRLLAMIPTVSPDAHSQSRQAGSEMIHSFGDFAVSNPVINAGAVFFADQRIARVLRRAGFEKIHQIIRRLIHIAVFAILENRHKISPPLLLLFVGSLDQKNSVTGFGQRVGMELDSRTTVKKYENQPPDGYLFTNAKGLMV